LAELIATGECEGVHNREDERDDYREDMKLATHPTGASNFAHGDLGRNLLTSGSQRN
jgi:hypothetical protein